MPPPGTTTPRRLSRGAAARALAAAAFAWPLCGLAFANVEVGQTLENQEMPTLDGRRESLLSGRAQANVIVFFRPGQEHSLATLKAMAACEREFEKRPVRWVAVVSDGWPAAEVRATIAEAGVRMPVLVDVADELYGRLGVRLHPVIGIADGKFRLLDYLPFHKINYCDMVRIRLRRALGDVGQAAVDAVDHPARATMPGEIPGAVARRHVKLGEALLRNRQPAKAEASARTALETAPDLASAHALLGRALAAQGRCADATQAFEAALKLDPAAPGAAAGRQACAGKR